jgi:hypothetical protein
LPLCRLPDQALAVLGKAHNGGSQSAAFGGSDHNGIAALDNRDNAICRTQVNANYFTHVNVLLNGVTSKNNHYASQGVAGLRLPATALHDLILRLQR